MEEQLYKYVLWTLQLRKNIVQIYLGKYMVVQDKKKDLSIDPNSIKMWYTLV